MSASLGGEKAKQGRRRAGGDDASASLGAIDRRSPVPYFFQLKSLISKELDGGRWAPGDRIPSEADLCKRFGVSRATVRQALAELEREGRLRKEKGRGTFVSEPRSNAWFLQSSHGFYDEASDAGRTVTSKVLRNEVAPLPGWAALALGAAPGSDGVLLERLRAVDGEVVMYVESYLRTELAALVGGAQLEHASLYQVLREGAGIEVAGGRRVVEATTAPAHLAKLLEIKRGSPLLYVEAISIDGEERPFETYRAWHRSDRTKIAVQVVGNELAATAGIDTPTLALDS
jgi:GntR family transcriptional regulator